MHAKHIVNGPEGRRMIEADGQPRRAALPLHCVEDACDDQEKAILLRFTEASELSKGNYAVSVIEGEARGRYALFAGKVDFEVYRDAEVGAYRWILGSAFGPKAAKLAEVLARLNGDRIQTFDFVDFGRMLANSDVEDIALGAAIGSARACAWMLADAYRDYAQFWKVRQAAAQTGRLLTADEAVQRQRRGDITSRVIQNFQPVIDGKVVG